MIALLDETTPENSQGLFYVVSVAICLEHEDEARAGVVEIVASRTRGFHWAEEGPEARAAMCEVIETLAVVSHVWVHHPTGRRRQETARRAAIWEVLPKLRHEGVAKLILESRGRSLDIRDQGVILDWLRENGGWDLVYSWATKSEPLLWIADALCGAVREHLLDENQAWFQRLRAAGVIPDPLTYRSGL